ncbi:MAG: M61 family peptidase [Cyanobacteriota bacterium]|nr:M61 family peptidase [Cyanobacteriota bacterium]
MPLLTLRLTEPHRQLVRAKLQLTPRSRLLRFSLPQWTPGSYLIRHYVRRLESLVLHQSGQTPTLQRTGVASWECQLPTLDPLEVRYQILAPELSVRTCHLSVDHGFLVLAALALAMEGERWSAHRLRLELPDGWEAFVPLPRVGEHQWEACDFDQLIDTPVEAGPHPSHLFHVAEVPHRWVEWGGDLPAEDPHWLEDLNRIALACCRLMGVTRPAADHYLMVLHRTENGYGGLEHDSSCVLQFGRRALCQPDGRRKLLQLVAHEYLHQWNVRRLRPAELIPYDYETAVVVPTLWFAEGLTSYLDLLLPHSAGITREEEVLEDLSTDLSRYLLNSGRHIQSLRASSQEAWVKLYLADDHSWGTQISYYLKGAVLALVLDLHLRARGTALPEVLRSLWRNQGGIGRGYSEADLLSAFSAADPSLASLLPEWLSSTQDPPLEQALAWVGLRLEAESATIPSAGWQLEDCTGGPRVKRLEREAPARSAGLSVGDELLALDGRRLRSVEDVERELARLAPLQSRELLWVRDGLVRRSSLVPAAPGISRWRLVNRDGSGSLEAGRRAAWLQLTVP